MRIISIDVGIKNLALCTIDTNLNSILYWQVINLCDGDPTCKHTTRKGLCGKNASYQKDNMFYCASHASKSGYDIPKNIPTCANFNKMERENLNSMACDIGLTDYQKITKYQLATKIRAHKIQEALTVIPPRNANTIELPELAKLLQSKLDSLVTLKDVDEIIIENQVSPIANRMKCLQSMLTQYFIMRGVPSVKFVSAANKLRMVTEGKQTYTERKKLGVFVTRRYLKHVSSQYQTMFDIHAKKDDLADALLQGLSYLIDKNHIDNIFLNADYLK